MFFQLQRKFVVWTKLSKSIVNLKQVATSPSKIGQYLSDLRVAEQLARQELYTHLGNIIFFVFGLLGDPRFKHWQNQSRFKSRQGRSPVQTLAKLVPG